MSITSDLPPVSAMSDAPADTFPAYEPEPQGPDHTRVPPGSVPPPDAQVPPPRSFPKPVEDVLNRAKQKLGNNTKRGSGVRALTVKDRDKIANFYRMLSGGLMLVRPKAARLAELSAEECADQWMRWAQENDNTRRWILTMLEGSAVMGVAMSNLPILIACVPDSLFDKLPPIFQLMNPDILIAQKEAQQAAQQAAQETE